MRGPGGTNLISGQLLPQGGGMWGALHTPTRLHSPSAFHWGHSFLLWGGSGSEPELNSLKITPTIARGRERGGGRGGEREHTQKTYKEAKVSMQQVKLNAIQGLTFKRYLSHLFVSVHACTPEDDLQVLVAMWVSGIELRSSDMAASACTHKKFCRC